MKLAVFSFDMGFLTSWEGKWSWEPKDALLHNDDANQERQAVTVNGKYDAVWINPDDYRNISVNQAVNELCVQINSLLNGQDIADYMTRITGCEWKYLEDSVWECGGRTMEGDNIIETLNETNIETETLCAALNEISDIRYWEGEDSENIHTSPAPDYDIFKNRAESLLAELEGLVEYHLKDDGDTSEDSQKIGFRIALQEVDSLLNGTAKSDVKAFNDTV